MKNDTRRVRQNERANYCWAEAWLAPLAKRGFCALRLAPEQDESMTDTETLRVEGYQGDRNKGVSNGFSSEHLIVAKHTEQVCKATKGNHTTGSLQPSMSMPNNLINIIRNWGLPKDGIVQPFRAEDMSTFRQAGALCKTCELVSEEGQSYLTSGQASVPDCFALSPAVNALMPFALHHEVSKALTRGKMTKKMTIYGLDPEKLGKLIGGLIAAGISPRGLNNFLWLLKYRRQVLKFLVWVKRN